MSLRVEPLKDADVEESIRMQYAAFRFDPNTIGRFLSPSDVQSSESLAAQSQGRRQEMRENPFARFKTVVDTSTNKIIACAHWEIYTEERTEEEQKKLTQVKPAPPDAVADAWNDFFGNFSHQRKTVMGTRPIAFLATLVTHPDHVRRGAGTLLMKAFVEEIDAAGVEGYIEASAMGKLLYERFGFEPVVVKEFPLEKYGGSGIDRNTVMIRPRASS